MWDGILEAQSKHIITEWSEVFQERTLDLLDEESLSLYMYCRFFGVGTSITKLGSIQRLG